MLLVMCFNLLYIRLRLSSKRFSTHLWLCSHCTQIVFSFQNLQYWLSIQVCVDCVVYDDRMFVLGWNIPLISSACTSVAIEMLKASAQCQDHLMQQQQSGKKICQKDWPRLMSIKSSYHGIELKCTLKRKCPTFYTFIHMVCLKPLTHLLHSDLHKSNQTETWLVSCVAVQTTNN